MVSKYWSDNLVTHLLLHLYEDIFGSYHITCASSSHCCIFQLVQIQNDEYISQKSLLSGPFKCFTGIMCKATAMLRQFTSNPTLLVPCRSMLAESNPFGIVQYFIIA